MPQATVTRLASYLRVLEAMADSGIAIVSSGELADASGVGSAKLRKDLSFLGPNGVRGVGYDVRRLRARIESALGLERGHRVVIVGAGNLGRALAGYGGFAGRGFPVVGLFDTDPALVGTAVGAVTVRHLDVLAASCAEFEATIGVVATPDSAAQIVCDALVAAGLRRIMSFSPVQVEVPGGVELRVVDLAAELQVLSFHGIRNGHHEDGAATASSLDDAGTAPASSSRVRFPGPAVSPSPVSRNGSVIAP
nr:redox-sensing transcriptional repressor Rex [Rhodococcus rhodnii]